MMALITTTVLFDKVPFRKEADKAIIFSWRKNFDLGSKISKTFSVIVLPVFAGCASLMYFVLF